MQKPANIVLRPCRGRRPERTALMENASRGKHCAQLWNETPTPTRKIRKTSPLTPTPIVEQHNKKKIARWNDFLIVRVIDTARSGQRSWNVFTCPSYRSICPHVFFTCDVYVCVFFFYLHCRAALELSFIFFYSRKNWFRIKHDGFLFYS